MDMNQLIFITILCLIPINAKQEERIDQKLSKVRDISKNTEDFQYIHIMNETIQEALYFNRNIKFLKINGISAFFCLFPS